MSSVKIKILPYAVAKMIFLTYKYNDERAGFIVCTKENDTLTVTDVIVPKEQESTAINVELRPFSMYLAFRNLQKYNRKNEFLCGWFHTHPGLGANFMSGIDITTHNKIKAFYKDAIAIVLDPVALLKSRRFSERTFNVYTTLGNQYISLDFSITPNTDSTWAIFDEFLLWSKVPMFLSEVKVEKIMEEKSASFQKEKYAGVFYASYLLYIILLIVVFLASLI